MDDFFDIPTLIVIGIAIVVLFRLRSVLGTRTGNERTPLQRRQQAEAPAEQRAANDETVVPLRRPAEAAAPNLDADRQARKVAAEIEQFSHGDKAVADGLKQIADADPTFSPKGFMDGAKAAYEMIVTAFAQGDRKTLRMLLEKDVYDGFEKAIDDREKSGRKVDFTFVGLPKVEISEAELDKRNASVTVRFNAEVVSATRDKDGTLIEGNGDQVQTIADEWTFARSPRSRDPNWKLVATNQLS
jgi:predicted lipid-binding transport protein (Tim44 family)